MSRGRWSRHKTRTSPRASRLWASLPHRSPRWRNASSGSRPVHRASSTACRGTLAYPSATARSRHIGAGLTTPRQQEGRGLIAQMRLGLAVLFVATVVACGPAAPSAQSSPTASASASASVGPTKGGTLRIGYGAEVDNLNAFTSQFLTDIEMTMVEGIIVCNDKQT